MFKTHLAFGFFIGVLSSKFFNLKNPFIFILLITIFSALPDIDHPKSRIGRKFFFISWPISLFFKHRGFFHSMFPPLIVYFILEYYTFSLFAWTIGLGYFSHLLGDALTKEGINFLNPFSTLKLRGPIKTGGKIEKMILLFFLSLDAILFFRLVIS